MWPNSLIFFALFVVQVSCQYKNSLTFVIGDTGSIGDELAEVKKAAKSIVDIVLNEKASQIEDIVLVTFNDPGVAFRNRTRNADVFKQALDQVNIHDGYCSAKSLTGIKLALEESLPGSYLFVFTDAGSNDLYLLEEVISLCREKQSQIVFVLTENNCETTAEYYYRIARASNGQVLVVSKEQIGQVIEYVKETIKGDQSVITNQMAPPRRLTYVQFYIDDKTEYAIVSVSGRHVYLKMKDNLNRNLISGSSRIMWTENIKVLKLANIRTGRAYVAQVYGSTNVNVMVFARTNFTFGYGFSNEQEHSLSTTVTQPTIGRPTHLMILVRDEKNSVMVEAVQILDVNEKVLANLSLTNMAGKLYATEQFEPPEQTFKVAVTAIVRSTRRPLRRIAKTPVAPIRPSTEAPKIADSETYLKKREGSSVDIGCRIQKGNPTPHLRWFFMKKDTTDYVQMRDATNEVLRLTNVLMDNEGHYKCEAENTAGRAEHIVQLEVEVAPMIADSEIYHKTIEGSAVDISCRIQKGNPTPHIRWFFMQKDTTDYVQMTDATNEVFCLTDVLMDSEGHYKCEAENTAGRAEHIVQLEVEVAPMIADSEIYLKKREGSTVDIGCRIQKGNPTPHIRWFFMKKGTSDYEQMRDATNEVLRLTNVLMDSEGHYKCEAENTAGRAERIVQLEVEEAPKIVDSEIYLNKREGSSVEIGCRIQKGNPRPTIRWFFMKKGTTDYVQMTDATNEVLRLTNVLMDSEGHYKCEAENTAGRAQHVVQLEVEVAPKIADSETYLKKREGSAVVISCRIQKGNPTPHIRWFFMKKDTTDYVQVTDATNEVLRLTNVLMDSEGHYKCEAENTAGRAQHKVQLEVEVAPKIADSEIYLNMREGSSVDIGCRIQKGNPTPHIRWFFMKKGTTDYVQMTDATNEVLRLTNVLVDSEGHYKCEAENTAGRAEHVVQLEVEVAPMIADSEIYLKKREGSTVDIGCRIQKGNPTPHIRWFFMKKGTSDYEQMRDATNEVLRLTNVLMDSEGHYKCEAENTAGRAERIVQLEVEEAPKIVDSEIYLNKREGSSVEIGCRIQKGNPRPTIRWFFMKKGTTDYVQMTDATNEVLRLTNVLMDSEGHYKCEAENTAGRAQHVVQLEVEVAPKIADSETYLKKREGSAVVISCRIQKGNPTPHIRWFFMKKDTTDYVQVTDATNEVLRLTNVLMDSEGHYKCEAENTAGRAQHKVQLEVEVAPKIADSEIYLNMREGSSVDIGCRIQKGNPTPHIRWFFMKKGTTDYVQMTDATNEVLRLTNVLVDSEGHYKCEAENTAGRAEHVVQLEVEVAPMIADSEIYLKKREGSTVDIGCRIQKGNPTPHLRWFFKKKGTTDYVQMRDATNEVLRLTNVLMDSEGHYKCEAENTAGRAQHIVQLEVEVPPMIADSETYLTKREGSTVDISCRIQKGNPTPHIRWFFMKTGTSDYVQMRDTTNEVLRLPNGLYLVRRTLTNVLMDSEGHYKCVAENTAGRAEHVVQLEVEVAPKISDSERYFNTTQGGSVDIHCRILQAKPQPQITWYFKQQEARGFELLRNKTEQVLHLTDIVMDNAGDYKCVAENVVNRAELVVQLEVGVPPRIVLSPPNEPKYRGVEGDVVMKLSCIAEGHPKPIISWTIDNYTIGTDKSSQSYVEDGSLFVKNPILANSVNTYVCVATNAVGEDRQTYEVLISEFEDYNEPEKMYGEVGKPYDINCSLPFTDPTSVRWFYNSVYLNVTGASIRWESASQANDGSYTCRVSDLSGAASVTVELTFGLPPAPSFGETEFEVDWDDMLQVACMADLNMIGTYEWYRNGERIKDANERELNVHQFGWGNYTCRAANPLGSLNITYNIPSQDCVIDKNLWTTKQMPVIIDTIPAWSTFSNNQKFVVVPQSEELRLVCQDDPPRGESVQPHSLNNSFTKFPSIRSIEATCDHEDTFLVDGVSQKISELDCIQTVSPSVVFTGKQCLGENTQMIDVGFYVDDLIKVYSSCLDTDRDLLLYTTVTMKGSDVPREGREPERPCKQVADCCYETVELVSAEDVGFGAAEWASLKEPRNSVFYCRPREDTDTTDNPSLQRSTTELPPDPETSWHDIERQVRNGPRMTVWSGAGNYTQVGDLMVPQYLWKVVKNLDDDMIFAIVHSNAQAPIPKLCADDCRSPSLLALFEPHGDRTYCCSLDEFKTAFKLPLAF